MDQVPPPAPNRDRRGKSLVVTSDVVIAKAPMKGERASMVARAPEGGVAEQLPVLLLLLLLASHWDIVRA